MLYDTSHSPKPSAARLHRATFLHQYVQIILSQYIILLQYIAQYIVQIIMLNILSDVIYRPEFARVFALHTRTHKIEISPILA